MANKPSYIGLLNAISNGERRGYELLSAWAKTTSDAELASTLNIVAIREAEHAWAFEKRLCELGFALRPKEDAKHAERMACACGDASDAEKFQFLGLGRAPDASEPDGLLQLLADRSIDPQTAGLLGRFIAEERDSGRLLNAACAAVHAKTAAPAADRADVLTEICRQLAALHEKVEALSASAGPRKLEAVR